MEQIKLLRVKQVSELTGIAVSTIWKYVRLEQFPKPFKLSMRVTVWKNNEIEEWIEAQLNGNPIVYGNEAE